MALGLLPGIPLFDGLAPPPLYRWVHPPAPLAPENTPPDSLSAGVPLTPGGSPAKDVVTGDGQVLVQLPQGVFATMPGQTSVRIEITPVNPATVPALPPRITVQGNVYRITTAYEPSGATATAVSPFGVQLRYPVDATMVAYNPGNGWQLLSTIPESAYLEVLGQGVTGSGLFAAVLTGVAPVKPARVPSWAFAATGVALVLAGLPALLARRRPRAAGPPE
ncbi:MAG TPA: hypothetical protein VHA57_05350 [Actinomycetota bacterium]|nr:hypothetical protein [Actinomycetota bacterium]